MSTKFQYNLTDAWEVALSQGHSAFRLLKIASDIESEYDDLALILESTSYGGPEYLAALGQRQFLTKDMLKISSSSVAAFQAMMEGLINNAIASEASLSSVKNAISNKNGKWEKTPFAQKWQKALEELEQPLCEFNTYYEVMYRRFRIPLIHPHDAILADIDQLDCDAMRSGYRAGWGAFTQLYDGLKKSHDSNSWEKMCACHNLEA